MKNPQSDERKFESKELEEKFRNFIPISEGNPQFKELGPEFSLPNFNTGQNKEKRLINLGSEGEYHKMKHKLISASQPHSFQSINNSSDQNAQKIASKK